MSILVKYVKDEFQKILKDNNLWIENKNCIIGKTKIQTNGHFYTNYAMISSKNFNMNPIDFGEKIVSLIKGSDVFSKVEFVKPGFINFWLNQKVFSDTAKEILSKENNFAKNLDDKYYNLEIISANPTGWLHIGHARNGVVGDVYARVLKHLGNKVKVEYYTNDAGNQINICAITIFYYYKKNQGLEIQTPPEMYGGDMYSDVGDLFIDKFKDKYIKCNIDYENNKIDDDSVHELFKSEVVKTFLTEIKKQINEARIEIDLFTSEKKMYEDREVEKLIELCKQKEVVYEKDGALWIKTSELGDDKDRVLVKSDGSLTYMTPDLACHNVRFKRESSAYKFINFWGGDHHGYIPRLTVGLELLGYDVKNIYSVALIQMVRLIKDGSELKISKRKGTAVWMQDIIDEIGVDALRYMLNSKASTTHLDFDLDIVLQKNSTNPVYYVQYCVARCNQVIEKFKETNIKISEYNFDLLVEEKEIELIILADQLPDMLMSVRDNIAPHLVCDYAYNFAKTFHSYYSDVKFIQEDQELTKQRISLCKLVLNIMTICHELIGIELKRKM